MSKGTETPKKSLTLNFTVKATTERSGGNSCHFNQKLRRLSIPASKCKGVKQYEVSGMEGADALCLTPSTDGRAVHPTQHFITVPASIAGGMKSEQYEIADATEYGMADGVIVLLGEGVKLADLATEVADDETADETADEKADETPTPAK